MFSVLQTPNYGIFQVVDGKFIDVSGAGLVTSPLEESSTCFPLFLIRRGGRFLKEGLTPLRKSYFPPPLIREGDKGGGFPNKNLKGERFINNLQSYV